MVLKSITINKLHKDNENSYVNDKFTFMQET